MKTKPEAVILAARRLAVVGVVGLLALVSLSVSPAQADHHPGTSGEHGSAGTPDNGSGEDKYSPPTASTAAYDAVRFKAIENIENATRRRGGPYTGPNPLPFQRLSPPTDMFPSGSGESGGLDFDKKCGCMRNTMEDILMPVAIDLDGGGVRQVVVTTDTIIGSDHYEMRQGWVGPGDGLLVYDSNANGRVDQLDEWVLSLLTSDRSDTDYQAFASQVRNDTRTRNTSQRGNQIFDRNDAMFSSVGVWQDKNQNQIFDDGEYRTLESWGITSLNLQRIWGNRFGPREHEAGTTFAVFMTSWSSGRATLGRDLALKVKATPLSPVYERKGSCSSDIGCRDVCVAYCPPRNNYEGQSPN